MLSLKIDAATRMDRSFLGINVQYIDMEKQKIILKTLALKEIFVRHTAENLKQIVAEVLDSYKIKRQQIYTFTTDNGMRCAAHTLQLAVEDALNKDETANALISKARSVVNVLRTPTYTVLLKREKLRKPVIDVVTRWHSKMSMFSTIRNENKNTVMYQPSDQEDITSETEDVDDTLELLLKKYDKEKGKQ
ncbi:hypothetical protein ILUMI_14008 [Ignelater luminosus]|uniref:Uncharacterized protein n=1 Tax=Ignelater luminosus TaxID=2038154 RepID=A0A8K0CZK1_IGNLU|nr:hypothetical protein ILUMI_14008 [Ignelater luminosus]